MSRYTVVLVGVPARVCDEVVEGLKADFSTNHLIIADRAPAYRNGYALYDEAGVQRALTACTVAVFGRTKRPFSFCRRPTQQCALRAQRKAHVNCGAAHDQACGLEKPEHLVVLYQAAKDDSPLLRALGFSALARRIHAGCYGHAKQTLIAARSALGEAKSKLSELTQWVNQQANTPLLLPLSNFNPHAVLGLLKRSTVERDISSVIKRFHGACWETTKRGFVSHSQLVFCPTHKSIAHGGRGPEDEEKKALRTEYRLGCAYDPGFHYDVSHAVQANLARLRGFAGFSVRHPLPINELAGKVCTTAGGE
jgi:hypothetical protein